MQSLLLIDWDNDILSIEQIELFGPFPDECMRSTVKERDA